MLEKRDYLVHCMREKGVYIHLDTNAGQVLKSSDEFTDEEVAAGSSDALRAVHFFMTKL